MQSTVATDFTLVVDNRVQSAVRCLQKNLPVLVEQQEETEETETSS